jgi:hypothetical protein
MEPGNRVIFYQPQTHADKRRQKQGYLRTSAAHLIKADLLP